MEIFEKSFTVSKVVFLMKNIFGASLPMHRNITDNVVRGDAIINPEDPMTKTQLFKHIAGRMWSPKSHNEYIEKKIKMMSRDILIKTLKMNIIFILPVHNRQKKITYVFYPISNLEKFETFFKSFSEFLIV